MTLLNVSELNDATGEAFLSPVHSPADLHHTAKRVLNIVLLLLKHLQIEESVLMQRVAPSSDLPLPYNTLRKYIRTLRYAGFDIVRKRRDDKVFYHLNDTKFHLDLTVQHAQGFEEWVTSLSKSSPLYRKLMFLVTTPFRMEFWDPHFDYGRVSPVLMLNSVETLPLLKDAMKHKYLLKFTRFDDTSSLQHLNPFWAVPYAIHSFRQRDAIISCWHPYELVPYYIKLSDIRTVEIAEESTNQSPWFRPIDFQITLDPLLAKRYKLKPHETCLSISGSGALTLQVSREMQYQALARCLKYAHLVQVTHNESFIERLNQFQTIQQRIIEETIILD